MHFADDGSEQATTILSTHSGVERSIRFSGSASPSEEDRLVYLPAGDALCAGSAFEWPVSGQRVAAEGSAAVPASLGVGGYKLCVCGRQNSAGVCAILDRKWRGLDLSLQVVRAPPPSPSPPAPPSPTSPALDSPPSNVLTTSLTAGVSALGALVLIGAVTAAAVGRRKLRKRKAKRARLPTLVAFDKPYDVFLSYRVASEAALVERLYDILTEKGVKVWWDKRCLRPAQKWEDGFVDGMLSSVVIVPVLSARLLHGFEKLTPCPHARCDNVLLEHVLALEWVARGEVKGIFPLMVGERQDDGRYASFFEGKAATKLPAVHVAAVTGKLRHHLKRAKKGTPVSSAATSATVPEVLDGLLEYQGAAMADDDAAAIEAAAAAIATAAADVRVAMAAAAWSKASGPAVQNKWGSKSLSRLLGSTATEPDLAGAEGSEVSRGCVGPSSPPRRSGSRASAGRSSATSARSSLFNRGSVDSGGGSTAHLGEFSAARTQRELVGGGAGGSRCGQIRSEHI